MPRQISHRKALKIQQLLRMGAMTKSISKALKVNEGTIRAVKMKGADHWACSQTKRRRVRQLERRFGLLLHNDPTPQEIAEMCAKIRKSWTADEREQRRVVKQRRAELSVVACRDLELAAMESPVWQTI